MNCKNCNANCGSKGNDREIACSGYRPMTNSDRIRHMTDEELSVLLNNQRYWPVWCDDNCQTVCRDCCLKWLKEEA